VAIRDLPTEPVELAPDPVTVPGGRSWRRKGALRRLGRAMRSNRKATVGFAIFFAFGVMALIPGLIAPYDPNAQIFTPGLGPSWHHLLGTTSSGQDIFSQVIWGARNSMEIALLVGILSTILSVVVGLSSAYLGGLWDDSLSVVTDIFLVIPTFPLIIVIAAYAKGGGNTGLLVVVAVLVLTGWSYGSRQLRAQALSMRNREFLESAKVRGERRSYVIFAEMLPSMTSLIVASFLGAALYAVLAAASLQFIGLGDPNTQSWGTMLYWAENAEALQAGMPLWAIVPGLCVAALGAAFALMNYAFDEISNPALRPVRKPRGRRDP
jgi:peptide/nickel transport system permease protein